MTDISEFNINNTLYNLKDTQARNSIADNFDISTSYSTNDLVLYDGQLYKFTSDHEAGEWDSNEAVTTNISNNYLPLTGGTLTGSLTTFLQLIVKDNTIDTSTSPESDVWPRHLIIKDKDNEDRGHVEVYNRNNGTQGIQLETKRIINNSNVYNGLQLGIDSEGNRIVKINEAKPWRIALGANSDGIWPVSLGGTGVTSIASILNTFATTITTGTRNTSNTSAGTINIHKFGKVIMVHSYNTITTSAAIASGKSLVLGTVPSSYRPDYTISVYGGNSNYPGQVLIATGGNITYYNTGSSSAPSGTKINFCAIYIVE